MKKVPLGKFLLSAQAGIACGTRDYSGIAQLRLNNLLTNGSVDFSGHIRIPADLVPDEMLLRKGDVLFNNTNSVELVGKTVYFDGHKEKITFSNHVTRLRVKEDQLAPEYLAFWLQHQWRSKVFEGICDRWIGQAAVQRSKLEALEIPAPLLDEQLQIAARLKAQLAEVETARQAAQVQLRDAAVLKTKALESLFSNIASWAQIGDAAKLQSGYAFKSDNFKTSGVRLLRNANIFPGQVYWDDAVFLSESDSEKYPSYALSTGDVLISLDRPIISSGIKVARVGAGDLPALLVQRVGRFLIDPQRLDADYLYAYLQTDLFISKISGHDQSLGVPHISPSQVEGIQIPLPEVSVQRSLSKQLNEVCCTWDVAAAAMQSQLNDLSKLPKAILAQAFAQ